MSSPSIILTGASKGLGLAILKILLQRHNARVTTLSRSYTEDLKAIVEEYGPDRVVVVQGDIGNAADNARLVKAAIDAFGQLDGLILNAASLEPFGRLADLPHDSLVPYMQINVFSTIYMIQAALPYLRSNDGSQRGRVVVTSSGASTGEFAGLGLYSMSKAAQNCLVRTLAAEKEKGVLAFAVMPGMIDTDMQKRLREKGGSFLDPELVAALIKAFEKGALLRPEQPGAAIARLAVNGPAELSGQYIDWSDERLAECQSWLRTCFGAFVQIIYQCIVSLESLPLGHTIAYSATDLLPFIY